jgi:hypothetical protein
MIDLTPIQRFMLRVAKMAQFKQGDMRISLAEAAELSACLAHVLVDIRLPAVVVTKDPAPETIAGPPSIVDGGGLKA